MSMRMLPTRGFLLKFKKKLYTIETAYKILEKKRDELVKRLREDITKLKELRVKIIEIYKRVFFEFLSTYGLNGEETIACATSMTRGKLKVEVLPRTIMGVIIPSVRVIETPNIDNLPIVLRKIAFELLTLLNSFIELVMLETRIEYITHDLQRTNRIVNILEKVIIPNMKKQLQKISEMIEEIELEEFTRTKIIRDKILKRRVQ